MTRLIDASFVVRCAEAEFDEEDSSKVRWLISHIPTVDAEPVRHGRWGTRVEVHGDPYDDGLWEEVIAQCSECGREVYLDTDECVLGNVRKELAKYPYCHCGAKMDGDTQCDSSKV